MTSQPTVPTDPAIRPASRLFTNSTPLLGDPAALQARAREDGYLYLKGLLDRDTVLALRRQIFALLDREGLMNRTVDLMEGVADVPAVQAADVRSDIGVPAPVYEAVQRMEAFHALAHEPRLLALYEAFFGGEVLPHPRNIARIMLPHPQVHPTPPHQDYLHIQGDAETWTCWIPLGDVPGELGGLSILEGSHQAGLLGVTAGLGAGGLESILCGLGYEWAEGDYEAGDIITFHSHTVHKSLPSRLPDRIRLSCDFRYQAVREPVEERSLLPHGPYEWDDLYKGWTRKDLQYYWKKHELTMAGFDESIRWQKEKIC